MFVTQAITVINDCADRTRSQAPRLDLLSKGGHFTLKNLQKLRTWANGVGKTNTSGHLTARSICDIAAEGAASDHCALGRLHNVSTRTVGRSIPSAAHTALLTQNLLMEIVKEELTANPPDWASAFHRWDETKQKLRFSILKRMILQSVEVMVVMITVAWGWRSGPVHCLELALPPMPVASTSAGNLMSAIRNGYYSRPVWDFVCFLLRAATVFSARLSTRGKAAPHLLPRFWRR